MTSSRSAVLIVALLTAGCLATEEAPSVGPSATRTTPPTTSGPTRDPEGLVIGVPADPVSFLPPGIDETSMLIADLLYDPLYRLDVTRTAQPALASTLPEISDDGLTWRVPLRGGGTFHDGSPVRASDAVFTLELAASPSCPFGRELCDAVRRHTATAEAATVQELVITLREAWSPFLAVVLGRLPVLSEAAVRGATTDLVRAAAGLDAAALGESVADITEQTNADRCLVDLPPTGCRLGDHADELMEILARAGVQPPPAVRFAAVDGTIDAEAHGGALLQAVATLATVLGSDGVDQLAAAVPLVDVARDPLGGGPFRLDAYQPGEAIQLTRHEGHLPEPAASATARLRVVRDPAQAATALIGGDLDWLVEVQPDQAAILAAEPGIRVAAHPLAVVRSIVFNVRTGRVFQDPATRRAVLLCIDRSELVSEATGGIGTPAQIELGPGSWAIGAPGDPTAADPEAAAAALDAVGWTRGADGIYERGDIRLSAVISIRPTRTDLLAFARSAAEQLRACGIEFNVQEVELAGDLLGQLQWPNEFEAVLVARTLGVDPDSDSAAFEGSHITTADNPADANPGGYASSVVDRLLADARTESDQDERARLYGQVAEHFRSDPPSLPIWYEVGYAALSPRLTAPAGMPDPAQPRYWWDAWTWRLATP